jgi:ribosomal protein S18 acetylase RimI-like enzyme
MTSAIKIRRCNPEDSSALSLVGQATFLETFSGVLDGKDIVAYCEKAHSRDQYAAWLQDPAYGFWLAELDPGDAPVGFMVVAPADIPLPDLSSGDVELKRVYILGKFQGAGTGRRLVQEAVAHARAVSARRLLLRVYANNHAAIGFYERMGFKNLVTQTRRIGSRQYGDLIMGLDLKD